MRNVCARHEKPEARSQRPERVCLEEEWLKFPAFSLRASRAGYCHFAADCFGHAGLKPSKI